MLRKHWIVAAMRISQKRSGYGPVVNLWKRPWLVTLLGLGTLVYLFVFGKVDIPVFLRARSAFDTDQTHHAKRYCSIEARVVSVCLLHLREVVDEEGDGIAVFHKYELLRISSCGHDNDVLFRSHKGHVH